jgi:putative hydrolase of the HAD superfamily
VNHHVEAQLLAKALLVARGDVKDDAAARCVDKRTSETPALAHALSPLTAQEHQQHRHALHLSPHVGNSPSTKNAQVEKASLVGLCLAMSVKAVVFDVGGVLVSSPFVNIRAFERRSGLAPNFFVKPIVQGAAFIGLEAGTINREQFRTAFGDDCLALGGTRVDGEEWLRDLEENFEPSLPFLEAARRVKDAGLLVGVITNNWEGFSVRKVLPVAPDVLVESYRVKIRKPDPAIYQLCFRELERLSPGIRPEEIVFLDDIGANCKAAAALGWKAIRVERGKEEKALEQLWRYMGVPKASL